MERETTAGRAARGRGAARSAALAVALLVGATGVGAATPAGVSVAGRAAAQEAGTPVGGAAGATPSAGGAAGAACPAELHGEGAEPWVRSELYFGTTRPDGTAFGEKEWLAFLDEEVTPRFPDGLTVLTGIGQYRDEEGILQERSQVLIILYPSETAAESSALLEEIRDEYEEQFEQTSVLRADSRAVCTSF